MKMKGNTKTIGKGSGARGEGRRLPKGLHAGLALVLAVTGAAFLATEALPGGWLSAAASGDCLRVLIGLPAMVGGALSLGVAVRMLFAASAVGSPFAGGQSRRLFVMGILFLVPVALRVVVSFGCVLGAGSGVCAAADALSGQIEAIHVDILYIVAAIVSFYLSNLMKYGHFLQWFYDETI